MYWLTAPGGRAARARQFSRSPRCSCWRVFAGFPRALADRHRGSWPVRRSGRRARAELVRDEWTRRLRRRHTLFRSLASTGSCSVGKHASARAASIPSVAADSKERLMVEAIRDQWVIAVAVGVLVALVDVADDPQAMSVPCAHHRPAEGRSSMKMRTSIADAHLLDNSAIVSRPRACASRDGRDHGRGPETLAARIRGDGRGRCDRAVGDLLSGWKARSATSSTRSKTAQARSSPVYGVCEDATRRSRSPGCA